MKTTTYTILGLALVSPFIANACFYDLDVIGYGMMGYGRGMNFFMVAGGLTWTVVGVLAGVWLWKSINKK